MAAAGRRETANQFKERLTGIFADIAFERFQHFCSSRTLRQSMTVVRFSSGRVAIFVPQYWAQFFHDGRGPIQARPGKHLVFWLKDFREQDPRIAGGFPVRVTDIKRLTGGQFFALKHLQHLLGEEAGFRIVKRVGPMIGNPFFDLGSIGLLERLDTRAQWEFGGYVLDKLPGVNGIVRDTAHGRL